MANSSAPAASPAEPSARAPVRGLAVAITSMNSMRTLPATLECVRGLADRVVVVDSGSSDGSIEHARASGADVIVKPWAGHVAQKEFAIGLCGSSRWVLLLDSDEALDRRLADAIYRVTRPSDRDTAAGDVADSAADEAERIVGYEINRRLVMHDRALSHVFQPEWRLRLFRAGHGRVAGISPHDRIQVDGPVSRLDGDLLHSSFADAEDMLRRQLGYASVTAAEGVKGGTLLHVLLSPGAAFLKQFLLKQGFRDGWRGMLAAGGAAAAALMKHLAIAERRGLGREPRKERESREPRDP